MIEVRNISKNFKVHQALNDVSFTVEQGSVTGLIGPNGSGKTTLIRIMNGVLGASGGQVRVNGLDPFRETENVLAICGTLTEQSGLYENMSGRDNLIFSLKLSVYNMPKHESMNLWTCSNCRNISIGKWGPTVQA